MAFDQHRHRGHPHGDTVAPLTDQDGASWDGTSWDGATQDGINVVVDGSTDPGSPAVPGVQQVDGTVTASSIDPGTPEVAQTPSVTQTSPPPFDGVNYVADVYGSYAAASSLDSLGPAGVNAVALTADFGIDAQNSTVYQDDVPGGYTESDANVAATIDSATSLGLSVMVRPLIDFLPSNYETAPGETNAKNGSYSAGEFRSYYNPSDVSAFFASYQAMIVQEATLAQANGATLFCIGTELDQLTGPAYEADWTNIITAVRAVFSGKLTYSADWDDDLSPWQFGGSGLPAGTGNVATQVSFWSQLDYVGIDEYAPISDAANPTLNDLTAGWTQTPTDQISLDATGGQSLISYYEGIAASVGKPLIFTELGYANSSDAASSPATPGFDENGNADGAVADPTLQANLYQAFFDAWQQDGNGSLVGTYLWNWEPNASSVGPDNGINFSVQGQPAQAVVITGFTACYCRGTLILTDRGDVPVEQLRAGDLVRTLSGVLRPIVWLGHRRIDLARHPEPRFAQPIRIRANAFADGMPRRDLLVSPDHAIHVDGRLIPARQLRNDASITREERLAEVRYFHVELDRHDILLAEGLPAESYLDTGNRGLFDNGAAPLILHPDFPAGDGQAMRDALSCAPFATDVEPVWRRLARRAERLGYALPEIPSTTDPAPRVLVNGRPLMPIAFDDGGYVFVLPPHTTEARLLSRAAAPSEARPWLEDRRRLGVAVRRLMLRHGDDEMAVPLDHPALTDGWWDAEYDGTVPWRWTNGDAHLPIKRPATLLVVATGGTTTYPLDQPATRLIPAPAPSWAMHRKRRTR
jgi:Hint domain/GTA TIM-barrel-like domain